MKFNYLLILAAGFFIAACGDNEINSGINGDAGKSGLTGSNGSSGADGANGQDGFNSLITITRSNAIDPLLCVSQSGVILQSGLDLNRNLSLEVGEVQSFGLVCDGAAGPAGPQGPQGDPGTPASVPQYSIISVIDPCGNNPFVQDEVFMRLANGSILVLFADNANGNNPRLSILGPGSYVTTDGSNCHLSIDANLIVVDENNNYFYP